MELLTVLSFILLICYWIAKASDSLYFIYHVYYFHAGAEAYVKVEQLQCKKFIIVMIINSVIVIAIKMNKLYMNIMYMWNVLIF